MMQRHARPAYLLHQHFATALDFVEIRRPERLVGGAGEDQISDLEIAHRPIVRGREDVHFLGDPQRRLSHAIVRPDVADDCGIKLIAHRNDSVIADLSGVFGVQEKTGQHDVGIGRGDEKTEAFQGIDFITHPLNSNPQIAIALHR